MYNNLHHKSNFLR